MKIVHVITTINKGGAETHLVDLVRLQRENNYQVVVIYLKGDSYWAREYNKIGVSTVNLKIKNYWQLLFDRKLKRVLENFHPDIVHSHLGPAELYSFLNLKNTTNFVVSKHNRKKFAPIPFSKTLMRRIAKRASKVISISDAVALFLIKEGLSKDKIRTIHYGINSQPFKNVTKQQVKIFRDQYGVNNNTLLFGTVARLVTEKSLHTLIRGFAQFTKLTDLDVKLIIVGEGPLENELRNLVIELKETETIKFTGFLKNIPEVMNSIDVFVLTSITEGLGLVLLEAMAAKTAIIASNVAAIPEVVGKSGLLFTVQDHLDLATKMEKMSNIEVREKYSNLGFERACSLFTLEKMFSNTHSIYEEVLSS